MKKLGRAAVCVVLVGACAGVWACSSASAGGDAPGAAVTAVQAGNFVEIGGAPGKVSFTNNGTTADVDAVQREGRTVVVVPMWAAPGDATVSRADATVRDAKIVAAPAAVSPGSTFLEYLTTAEIAAEAPNGQDPERGAKVSADLKRLIGQIRAVVKSAQGSPQQIGVYNGTPLQLDSSGLSVLDGLISAANLPTVPLGSSSSVRVRDWATDKAALFAAGWTIFGVSEAIVGGAIFTATGGAGALPGLTIGGEGAIIAALSGSLFASIVNSPDFTPKQDARDAIRMFYEDTKARSARAAEILDRVLFPDAGAAERDASTPSDHVLPDGGRDTADDAGDDGGAPTCPVDTSGLSTVTSTLVVGSFTSVGGEINDGDYVLTAVTDETLADSCNDAPGGFNGLMLTFGGGKVRVANQTSQCTVYPYQTSETVITYDKAHKYSVSTDGKTLFVQNGGQSCFSAGGGSGGYTRVYTYTLKQ